MPLFLPQRSNGRQELMEDPACDPRKLRRTYDQFHAINTLVSGWGGIYRRHLRPEADGAPLTLLDVGFGGGDIPNRLARWAKRDGVDLRITAIDLDRRALDYVTSQEQPPNVEFRRQSLAEVLESGERYDFVISNHLLHHLSHPELERLCAGSRRLARRRVIHSDIVRSDLGYLCFAALTVPFFHDSFIVRDGLTSIRRSYTRRELTEAAPDGWRVERQFPYHQLLVYP